MARVIGNVNDGTDAPPALRVDLNIGNTWMLPDWSDGPQAGDPRQIHQAAKDAGFAGMQGGDAGICAELGMGCTAMGVLREHGALEAQAKLWADLGMECSTLHVGTGLEDDAEADDYFDEVIDTSVALDLPLYIETHRATLTQDIWRTVQAVERRPELRFNGDFSHWYTGLEMTYGELGDKLDFAAPVFERVRFMHGRIGDPGCIQVDVGADGSHPSVAHFRDFWTRSFAGFLATAAPGDVFCFCPELLPSFINYARMIPGDDGAPREEGDRWQQAILYGRIARECFEAAGGAPSAA